MPVVTDAIPVRALAGLTGAVLLAHFLVLRYTPFSLGVTDPVRARVFTTRSLQINAPAPVVQTQAARPVSPPPSPVAKAAGPRAPPRRDVVAVQARPADPAPQEAGEPEVTAPAAPQAPVEPIVSASTPAASEAGLPAVPPVPVVAQAPPAAAPAAASASAPSAVAVALPKDAALVARAYTVPGSVRLKFEATGLSAKMNYSAVGDLLWLLHEDNTYDARLEISILFKSRILTSTGRMTADGLAPTRFSDKYRSEQAAHFDRAKGKVTFSSNNPDVPLLPGAQDQLSIFIQLASMIAGEPSRFPAGTSMTIPTVGPRGAEPWIFTVDAEELLHLPGGEQTALRLIRNPRKEFDQKVEIWLAPKLGYLPARIRISQANGDFVDQKWKSTGPP